MFRHRCPIYVLYLHLNAPRNAFGILVEEKNRRKGSHADVIRLLRNIKDTKQFFGDACEVNGELNRNLTGISVYSDGIIPFNDATSPLSSEGDLVNSPGDHLATMNLNDNRTMSSSITHEHVLMAVNNLIELGIFVRSNEDLQSLMVELTEQVNIHVFDMFIDFMRSYFTKNCRCISEILNEKVSFECVFETAINIIRDSAQSSGVDVGEYIENIDSEYLRSQINVYYNRQGIRRNELRGRLTEHCKACFGTYYVQKKETV